MFQVTRAKETGGKTPTLAVVLVGDRKDSATYVRMKQKAAEDVGMGFRLAQFPSNISEEALLAEVVKLNADDNVDGVIVQLPLPGHINEKKIVSAVGIHKDVDGFHPENIGNLALKGREPLFVPGTPKGCMELLARLNIPLAGKHAVVLGRSNIVGMPMSLLLLHKDATVTVCHSKTANLKEIVRQADILVAAVGRAEMVRGDWLKPGAVVIDVGMNSIDDPTKKQGYRLVGDVAFDECRKVAAHITPVPGGVGPMTVAMLITATWTAFKRKHRLS